MFAKILATLALAGYVALSGSALADRIVTIMGARNAAIGGVH